MSSLTVRYFQCSDVGSDTILTFKIHMVPANTVLAFFFLFFFDITQNQQIKNTPTDGDTQPM